MSRQIHNSDGTIKKGESILLTSGSYSEYHVHVLVNATKSFNINRAHIEWQQTTENKHNEFEWVRFLLSTGYVKQIQCREICIKPYDNLLQVSTIQPM